MHDSSVTETLLCSICEFLGSLFEMFFVIEKRFWFSLLIYTLETPNKPLESI